MTLDQLLAVRSVQNVVIVGLVLDICVYESAIDALRRGYNTIIIQEAVQGNPEYLRKLSEFGAKVIYFAR